MQSLSGTIKERLYKKIVFMCLYYGPKTLACVATQELGRDNMHYILNSCIILVIII